MRATDAAHPDFKEKAGGFDVGVNDFSDQRRTAEKGVEALEAFYRIIGMPTSIHELIGREITDDEIKEMARRASHDGALKLGNIKVLEREDMIAIYKMAK